MRGDTKSVNERAAIGRFVIHSVSKMPAAIFGDGRASGRVGVSPERPDRSKGASCRHAPTRSPGAARDAQHGRRDAHPTQFTSFTSSEFRAIWTRNESRPVGWEMDDWEMDDFPRRVSFNNDERMKLKR
jgi:hypothetical protein